MTRRRSWCAAALAALVVLDPVAVVPKAAGAPWPQDEPHRDRVVSVVRASAHPLAAANRRLTAMERTVRRHEQTRARLERWLRCVHPLPVDRVGDPRHRWGFEYDERDGTGLDTRTALVRHQGRGDPDLLLLRFGREGGCVSRPPDPNGTGADARVAMSGTAGRRPRHGRTRSAVRRLERRVHRLQARIDRLERAFDRFDAWESCLSWLPVTEFGHTYQQLGFRYDGAAGPLAYVSAIDVDDSAWDDPDYELLAFVGRDRPLGPRECGHEPGESVDRSLVVARAGGRLAEVRRGLRDAGEDLEDLVEPVEEFVRFDECMFTVGVRDSGSPTRGYRFRTASGGLVRRSALSFDMTGLRLPQADVMAFPGEEPPQIECNEDAGGQSTDE